MGLSDSGSPFLPTWSESKCAWGDFEMGASEATNFLREALIAMGCHPGEVLGYGSPGAEGALLFTLRSRSNEH